MPEINPVPVRADLRVRPLAPSFALPFKEAINHFAGKVLNLPTEKSTDLLRHGHSRAFVVSGATIAELLTDLHTSIKQALTDGKTLAQFRQDFRETVKKYGWSYKGEEGWRTRIIYETNLSTAYAAGRWAQQTDPDVVASRPYLRYRIGPAMHHRPDHESWNNTVLPASDPWWQTHYPPNGWQCHCFAESITEAQAAAIVGADLRVSPLDPRVRPLPRPQYENQTTPWTNPSTGLTEQIPRGITPGWDYNPGMAKDMGDVAIWTNIKKSPEAIQTAFLTGMSKGAGERYKGVVDDWVDEISATSNIEYHAKGDIKTIGWMSPEVWKFVVAKRAEPSSPVISASDAGIVHALGDRKTSNQRLTPDQAKLIPEVVANPEAVLWDTEDAALLYVFKNDEDNKGKIIVRFDRKHTGRDKTRYNLFTTAGLIQKNNLTAKRYEVIIGGIK